jgi:uncharacterized protein (DUF983 family)
VIMCPNCHRRFNKRYGARCPFCGWIYTSRTIGDVIADIVFAIIITGVILGILRLALWAYVVASAFIGRL